MNPPLIVVHDDSALRVARADVEADGWLIREGLAPRAAPAALGPAVEDGRADEDGGDGPPGGRVLRGTGLLGTVLLGRVDDEDSASAALIGRVRGHGLLVLLAARDDVAARFLDDLLRFGRIDHRPHTPVGTGSVDLVTPAPDGVGDIGIRVDGVDLDLLRLLGDGSTVTQASKALHISRRTANRRLIVLRQAYGVATTAQLVSRSRSLGVIANSDRKRR